MTQVIAFQCDRCGQLTDEAYETEDEPGENRHFCLVCVRKMPELRRNYRLRFTNSERKEGE